MHMQLTNKIVALEKIITCSAEKSKEKKLSIILNESDKKNIQMLIKKLSIKDITDLISQNTEVAKKEIYNYCLKLKNEK